MLRRVLIMGLPGAGKTTLASEVCSLLSKRGVDVAHINGDDVRRRTGNNDFSPEGRLRQALDMRNKSYGAGEVVICDFVCPTYETRKTFLHYNDQDLIVWVDTISISRFEDTNCVWEDPTEYDFRVSSHFDKWPSRIADAILNGVRRFDPQAPTVQLLGRFQPWHEGHRALFEKAVAKTGQVSIMVRDCVGEKNPFPFHGVCKLIEADLSMDYPGQYVVIPVPNIVDITYGRDVGYTISEEHLPPEVEEISATRIRKEVYGRSC